jgi:sugar lactone lactonase YvrE
MGDRGLIRTIAGNGEPGYSGDGGPAIHAGLNEPKGLTFDQEGNLYIADSENHVIRKVDARGIISTIAGTPPMTPGEASAPDGGDGASPTMPEKTGGGFAGDGGSATAALLNFPSGVAVDDRGHLFIADTYNHRVRKVDLTTGLITTVAGTGVMEAGFEDEAEYHDDQGTRYGIGATPGQDKETEGNVKMVKTSSGEWTFVYKDLAEAAGKDWESIESADAPGPVTPLESPRTKEQKEQKAPGPVKLIQIQPLRKAPPGMQYALETELLEPNAVAVDPTGTLLYIADLGNARIWRVDLGTGFIEVIAGTETTKGTGESEYNGDGQPATQANLSYPYGLAVDLEGNIYIADTFAFRVRRVARATGLIETVAGDGKEFYFEPGRESQSIARPYGIAVDAQGNLYITDATNHLIRKWERTTGRVKTIAGNGMEGCTGDDFPPLATSLNYPTGVCVDKNGAIYIADTFNNRIRKSEC